MIDVGRALEARADLEAALSEEPEDEELLNRLRRVHLQRGERIAAAEVLERLASVAEKAGDERTRKRHLKRLVNEWKGQRAPERALAAQEALGGDEDAGGPAIPGMPAGLVLPAGAVITLNGVTFSGDEEAGKKGLSKSFEDVCGALDEGDVDTAREIFRRLWRQFPVGQPEPARFFSARRYRNLALANLRWPAEEDADDDEADKGPSVGGLLAYEPKEPAPRPEPPDAYRRIASTPSLVEEQRRFLRGVDAYELDRLQGLSGLIAVDVAAAGGGDAGESAVLDASSREPRPARPGGRSDPPARCRAPARPRHRRGRRCPAVPGLDHLARDAAQVLRLARVLQQSGDRETAARLTAGALSRPAATASTATRRSSTW